MVFCSAIQFTQMLIKHQMSPQSVMWKGIKPSINHSILDFASLQDVLQNPGVFVTRKLKINIVCLKQSSPGTAETEPQENSHSVHIIKEAVLREKKKILSLLVKIQITCHEKLILRCHLTNKHCLTITHKVKQVLYMYFCQS